MIEKIKETAAFLKNQTTLHPRIAIVLGSGLGGLVDYLKIEKEIEEIYFRFFYENSENRVLVTTEKDSMRLIYSNMSKILEDIPLFVQPIEPKFLFQGEEQFFTYWPIIR